MPLVLNQKELKKTAVPEDRVCPLSERELKARVQLIESRIIYMKELDEPSFEAFDVMAAEIHRFGDSLDYFYWLVDLTEVRGRPSAEYRSHLQHKILQFENLEHIGICIDINFFLGLATKFVLSRTGMPPFSLFRTVEEGLQALRDRDG